VKIAVVVFKTQRFLGGMLMPIYISNTHSGFIGGGQLGYNWQVLPQYVIGIEWLFDGTDIRGSGNGVTIGNALVTGSLHHDWVSTVTARFGYAANHWLFYGKAGAAWVQNSSTVSALFPNGAFGSVSGTNTSTGWTAGAGIEYGFAPNWTVKLEWDYIGLDNWNLDATPLVTVNPLVRTFVGDSFELHHNINMLTVGVNYIFY
jgi:outer membrane immunogenic protein